jgi:hypothetical protein
MAKKKESEKGKALKLLVQDYLKQREEGTVFSSKVDKFPLCKGDTGGSKITATRIPLTPFRKGGTFNSF